MKSRMYAGWPVWLGNRNWNMSVGAVENFGLKCIFSLVPTTAPSANTLNLK